MTRKLIALNLIVLTFLFHLILCGATFPLEQTDYSLTIYAGKKKYYFEYPEIDVGPNGLYLKKIDEIIDGIVLDSSIPYVDAQIIFSPNSEKKFSFIKEESGLRVDSVDLKAKIQSAIDNQKTEVTAVFQKTTPQFTIKDAISYTNLRSQFSTDYSSSTNGRKHNVELSAKYLNGYCLEKDEEFSFNQVIGERRYERGFTDAKIISEGKFTDGVGGGVCQLSTTLYNAVLLSGLTVTERHPHSLSVSYVEPSFDAMVSFGWCDLRFVNNTNGKLFIEATTDQNVLTVKIYGEKQNFVVKRKSTIIKTIDPGFEEIIDENLIDTDSLLIMPPKPYIISEGALLYYKNGSLIKNVNLGKSSYGGVKGILAIKPPKSNKNNGIEY